MGKKFYVSLTHSKSLDETNIIAMGFDQECAICLVKLQWIDRVFKFEGEHTFRLAADKRV